MNALILDLGKSFSRFPAGRFRSDGPNSGEKFRDEVLLPVLQQSNAPITIELDNALGYGSSFLEEAFGGLVRKGIASDTLKSRFHFVSEDGALVAEILDYIRDAATTAN
jgi:hypothetical protein